MANMARLCVTISAKASRGGAACPVSSRSFSDRTSARSARVSSARFTDETRRSCSTGFTR